jgi:hypothetical protein
MITTFEYTGAKYKPVQTSLQDKGHREELEAFANAVKRNTEWPIPLWQQLQVAEIALQVEKMLK